MDHFPLFLAYCFGLAIGAIMGVIITNSATTKYHMEQSAYVCYDKSQTVPANSLAKKAEQVPSADESKLCFRSEKLDK